MSTSLHTDSVVSEYFELHSQIFTSRAANAYKALDRSRNRSVTLWLSRQSLGIETPAVVEFLKTMKQIQDIRPPLSELVAYGVDSQGIAFSLFSPVDGGTVVSGNINIAEAERRYMTCVQLVSRLHSLGIACGDLCSSSFIVGRNGGVQLVGLMGSTESTESSEQEVVPVETLPYLAPGQKKGAPDMQSDVFALGVLGYYLFCRRFPYGEGEELLGKDFSLSDVPPLSEYVNVPPSWGQEVLFKCLNPQSGNRYRGATEILAAIQASRERTIASDALPQPTTSGAPGVTKKSETRVEEFRKSSSLPIPQSAPEEAVVKSRKILLLATVLVIVGVGATVPFLFKGTDVDNSTSLEEELKTHREAVTDEGLKTAIDTISEGDKELEEKVLQLKKIAESKDPLAHDILMKSAREAPNQKLRELSENALVERLRASGLTRTAEQARQWLRTLRPGQYPQTYTPLLRATNTSVPMEARFAALRQAYTINQHVALRLAVAMALDLKALDQFQPLLAQLVGDSMSFKDAKDYSSLSLILAHPDLALIFGEDIIQARGDIPSRDILWLLKILAKRNDINVRAVASLGVERKVLSPVKEFFLTKIRDRADLPPDVTRALIRASAGILDKEDVKSFGRWYDVDAEKILLALLVDVQKEELQREIFDTLVGKSLTLEPSTSLINWVRQNYWEDRTDFAEVVGVLGNIDKLSDEEVAKAFTTFDAAARDSDLLDILLETRHPVVVRMVVSKYNELLGLGTLLNLLDFPEKSVRITAVRSLREFNDIGALKLIIDYYDKEKDEDVRKVYQDTFWVIKKREEEGTKGFGFQP